MNALEKNSFTQSWNQLFTHLTGVRAILMVSAHWLTRGTQVTAMEKPRTIHDFGGFPRELFEVQYNASGSPDIANEIVQELAGFHAKPDTKWGLDHGTWSILMHALPEGKIPVLQLSIDAELEPADFFAIGRALRPLRDRGILVCGSGNIVHNLARVDWARLNETGFAHPWAKEADALVQELIQKRQWQQLVNFSQLPESMHLAINSAEHFVPLIYILGAAYEDEPLEIFNAVAVGGALTMTSVRFG